MPNEKQQSSLSDAAVEAIKESTATEIITVDGRQFVTRPVFTPPNPPRPDGLTFHTLKSLVDYVDGAAKIDPNTAAEIKLIHIDSPQRVRLYGPIHGSQLNRHAFAEATCSDSPYTFDRFLEPQDFIIALQTQFAPTGDRATVLRLVGNLRAEHVRTAEDDGVTQLVTVRKGAALKSDTDVPNPVMLAPFRTFAEIEQSLSPFILRVHQGKEGEMPKVGLFAVADDRWELEALAQIKALIESEMVTDLSILA